MRQGGVTTNSVAGEAVLDFIFWPSKKRRFGWYFDPSASTQRAAALDGGTRRLHCCGAELGRIGPGVDAKLAA